jgi:hypothetical protein
MASFWSYLGGAVTRPRSTFSRLVTDPRHLGHGAKAVLLIGVLYTLTVAGLAIVHAQIVTPAWVAIPEENYYFWEIFFAMPVYTMGWLLSGGLVQLISKPFKGSGTFEGTLATLAFALTLPALVTWIPETIGTLLFLLGVMTQEEWWEVISRPGFWKVFAEVYQFVALAWYLVLFPMAVGAAQKLRWWQAIIVGTLTLTLVGFLMLIFIR